MKRFVFFFFVIVFTLGLAHANESSVQELKRQIEDSKSEIEKIKEEIAKYEKELLKISKEKNTLKRALREIELSRKKTINQIYLTSKEIKKLESDIEEIKSGVKKKEEQIKNNKKSLAYLLRYFDRLDNRSFVEVLFSDNFSELLADLESVKKVQELIQKKNKELLSKKIELKNTQAELEKKKKELLQKKKNLYAQKRSFDIAKRAQESLIKKTKNKESNYQKILAQKRKAKEEFEAQLLAYESRLKYILDPNSIPKKGSKVFRWPLDRVRISQYFGNTKFARSGAYNGRGHNGIDMATPIGTPVKATLSGVVVDLGNTDRYKGCYSYGKWILIRHGNGLSTLYAHLSDIAVKRGDAVKTGQIIGYSGNSGYSTGPHLHLTVYVSDAVKVMKIGDYKKRRTACANARVPVAPLNAYLNPMDYLR